KPLAVGLSLYSSDDMQKLEKGRVMKNIHHVGDVLWTMEI
ncbi:MAG: RNA-binding protein, partial [Candidatus Aenigmarchaeota archaeon]|nr:RNA-binding protein [Candidatus Aenigmarchaeota archaeon]